MRERQGPTRREINSSAHSALLSLAILENRLVAQGVDLYAKPTDPAMGLQANLTLAGDIAKATHEHRQLTGTRITLDEYPDPLPFKPYIAIFPSTAPDEVTLAKHKTEARLTIERAAMIRQRSADKNDPKRKYLPRYYDKSDI